MSFDRLSLAGITLEELLRAAVWAVPIAIVLLLAHVRRARGTERISLLEPEERSAARRS